MQIELIGQKLEKREIVYIKDDYEEKAIRIIPNAESSIVYIKFKGKNEYLIDRTSKLVFDIKLGGDEITKEEYENY